MVQPDVGARARHGLDMVSSGLERAVVEGREYWFDPTSPGSGPTPPSAPPSPFVDLVQGYDEYVMSYSESKDVLRGPDGVLAPYGLQSDTPFIHTILLDGHVIGHWKHTLEKDAAAIETYLYRTLSSAERQVLSRAADRYGRYVGTAVTLRAPRLRRA